MLYVTLCQNVLLGCHVCINSLKNQVQYHQRLSFAMLTGSAKQAQQYPL